MTLLTLGGCPAFDVVVVEGVNDGAVVSAIVDVGVETFIRLNESSPVAIEFAPDELRLPALLNMVDARRLLKFDVTGLRVRELGG